ALVLHYHGWLDSSGEAAARSGLPRVADESGAFHAVFPEGAHDVGAPAGVWALALCGLGLLLLGALCLCCACRRARAREAPPGEGLADESIEFSGCASRGRHEESSDLALLRHLAQAPPAPPPAPPVPPAKARAAPALRCAGH
ncbi:unnamed protein product, partial [Prorocentrum cordatum]